MDLVRIGRVLRSHGLRGELRIRIEAEIIPDFEKVARIYLASGSTKPRPHRILAARFHQNDPLLLIEGVEGRNEADERKGSAVYLRRVDLPERPDGMPFEDDLKGLEAVMPDERVLGLIEAVLRTPAHDVWSVRTPEGREVLFPAVPAFIRGFDRQRGRVLIDPPEGLLDIYIP
ncbi:MAG: 16S rRNA processing protein RimM [Deltaproteobacteria bacterium]|nr:16S rRNA processing protein RimM [Deltaproteobacteria bacterium]